jgi:hypothetical protein
LETGTWLIEKKERPETPRQMALPIQDTILRGRPHGAGKRAFVMTPPRG